MYKTIERRVKNIRTKPVLDGSFLSKKSGKSKSITIVYENLSAASHKNVS